MNVTARWILHTIVDEGDFVSILSSIAWQDLGSPHLVPATDQILDFNFRPTSPLGIFPYLPITLGGKTICIDVIPKSCDHHVIRLLTYLLALNPSTRSGNPCCLLVFHENT